MSKMEKYSDGIKNSYRVVKVEEEEEEEKEV